MAPLYLAEPKPAPELHIPMSAATVDIRVIDSTTDIHIPPNVLFEPEIKGHDDLNCRAFSFLVSHESRHFLFDLGARKDLHNLAPKVRDRALQWGHVEKNVAEILDEGSHRVKSRDIEAVILSHHHWDHVGTMTSFPGSTALIVGPGFKKALEPFYPTGPDSAMLEEDVAGRSFREVDIVTEGMGLKIGRCDAFDFFSDGSFYLLSTPGHAPGHICALARVTRNPDTFILLAGDGCHHAGEIRPTEYQPLPAQVELPTIPKYTTCPGSVLQKLQREHSATKPFYSVNPGFASDHEACEESLRKIEEFDASDNVLVAMAHDASLKDVIRFYPDTANDWKANDAKNKSRWLFLDDFRKAIDGLSKYEE